MEPPSNESDRMEWPGNPTRGVDITTAAAVDDGGDMGQCYRGEGTNEPPSPMPFHPSTSTAPSSDDSSTHSCSSTTKTTCGYGTACTEGVVLCLSLGEQASNGLPPPHHLPSPAVLPTSSGSGKSLRRSREESDGRSGGRDCNGEFVCNECGLELTSLRELQLHMVRKTAWSNQGLVGCRVSCLVDNREWHEGVVTQYHKSGKHCVEYRRSGEKRWVNMLRTAFYSVERGQLSEGEVKEMEPDPTEGLAPVEELEKKRANIVEAALADLVVMEQIRSRDSGRTSEAADADVAAVHAANTRAIAGSLKALKKHCGSNIGRIAYNTALVVAAGEGEHTCDPANHATPLTVAVPLSSRMVLPFLNERIVSA